MLTLISGNLEEAIQEIKPEVLLNLTTSSGTGMHCLSSLLYRNYPEYTELLNKQKHSNIHMKQWSGRYVWKKGNQDDMIHVLSFMDHCNGLNNLIVGRNNIHLLHILQSVAFDMEQGNKKSIILPYCGAQQSGYRFHDFLDLIEAVFTDATVKIYIAVSQQYLERSTLPNRVFTRPHGANPTKRTIYAGETKPKTIHQPIRSGWVFGNAPTAAVYG